MQRYRRTPVEDNYYPEDALGAKVESKKQVIKQEADILTIDRLTPDVGPRAKSKVIWSLNVTVLFLYNSVSYQISGSYSS